MKASMEAFGFFISVFLIIGITGTIIYLLLFIRKRSHDSNSDGSEENKKILIDRLEVAKLYPLTVEKEIDTPIADEIVQETEFLEKENDTAAVDELIREPEFVDKEIDNTVVDEVAQESEPVVREPNIAVADEVVQESKTEVKFSDSNQSSFSVLPEEIQGVRPIKRGGRHIGGENEESQERDVKPRHPKPEIVCWEKGRQWILAVELPKELYNNGDVVVTQNSSPLEKDSSREYCWRLTQAFGKVSIHSNETFEIDLGKEDENSLLFKLSGENRREGRLVKLPSSGDYLVVVPADWKITNDIVVSNEQINVRYQAYWHIFDMADNRKMVFSTSKGEKKIQSKAPMFRLIGSSLNDASETMGTLFVENPPRINAHDITDWNDVVTIVIGDIGENKWRAEVPLTLEETTQNLPTEILERKSGWYFLRFYDMHDELMESIDFRFVRGLKKIKVPHLQPFPKERHETVQIEITHESDCIIESANAHLSNILVKPTENGTVLSIPPNPSYDKTRWRIGHSHSSLVEITILVERVWWNIGTKGEMPITWTDRFAPLTQESFSASDAALWLRFPIQRWVKEVIVGFQWEQARRYDVSVTEQMVCIPLKTEFEIRDLHHDHFLRVWLERGGKQCEGTVAVVAGLRPDWIGYGRKKSAIAVAMARKGTGEMEINGFSIPEYFQRAPSDANLYLQHMRGHDQIRDVLSQLDISFRVWGSSPNTKRQVMAVAHALAHLLIKYQPELTSTLQRFRGAKVSRSACEGKEGLQVESN